MEHDLKKANSQNEQRATDAEKLAEAIRESARMSSLANEFNYQYINGNLDSVNASEANPEASMSLQVINKRRNAVRQKKVHDINGHKFVVKTFSQPTCCPYCDEIFWGISKPGFQCQLCHCALHQKCSGKILSLCRKNPIIHLQITQNPNRLSINVPHQFNKFVVRSVTFTFCDHCGLIMRMFRHEYKCSSCGFKCHKSCADNCAHNCGVNERQISEILSNIVKKRPRRIQLHDMNFIHKLEPKMQKLSLFHRAKEPSVHTKSGIHTTHPSTKSHSTGNWTESSTFNSTLNESKTKLGLKDFTIQKMIGQGSFGKVFLVTKKNANARPEQENEYYALKCIKKDSILQDDNVGSIMVERDILKLGVRNPFITRSEGAFQNQDYIFFIMEFLNGGDLMFHIVESNKFPEDRARFYAAEILCGLQFLHNEGIIYRDLKLDNVLLDSGGHCKISDFGMCKKIEPNGKAQTFCGTPDYIAPEIIRGQMYNSSVDFWSYGVLVFEMLSGSSPFQGRDEDELFNAIQHANVLYPIFVSKEAQSFLNGLFDRDPTNRLGMKTSSHGQIREHPFFSRIDWVKLEKAEVDPPFKPTVKGASDVSNFDTDFTSENPRLSMSDATAFMLDDEIFKGFSFISPHLAQSIEPSST